jgi:KipI family sensor histidine kinase inhibitor
MIATPRIARLGEDALLCFFTAPDDTVPPLPVQQGLWQLCRLLEAERGALQLREIVPGMGNLLLRWNRPPDGPCPFTSLQARVLALWAACSEAPPTGRPVRIPVRYGGEAGPDLEEVARHCGLSPAEVITLHSRTTYAVYCLGFQPGFAYLGGLDPRLCTPRRDTPRLAIPAGSVAIGGCQTAVYPLSTPGGWQIIGHTTLRLFDPATTPGVLLQPGDTVRFEPLQEAT